ncbi:RNA-guided endonuclease InsQ/TnpB family protein [Nocardia sp. NPDC127526]|uniref:RNA-guided endonuclease InsQ/TnpB family protein n=1 Tax=Nocardia sp. NPDC127526 TaxID=3345393 RepID=UPI003642F75F
MKLVVQVKLLPDSGQVAALEDTLRTANYAACRLSERAQANPRRCGRTALQRDHYRDVKALGLSAQPALHVIRKVADAYTLRSANLRAGNYGPASGDRYRRVAERPIRFRPNAAQPFDDRCLSWQHDAGTVSIWTTRGRLKDLRFTGSPDQLKTLQLYRQGESDLVYRDGMWFLYATCDIPEGEPIDPQGWVGVDLGIVNIATTSGGYRAAGRGLNRHRGQKRRLRTKLQAKGTKSAKRVLKRQRRKETRRATDINHVISKSIVVEAQRTGHGIGLEDLTGIRERARLRKPQRTTLHSWAFAQLGTFIEYKARQRGVPVVFVDPHDTSRMCSACRYVDKNNRVSQAKFRCRSCGVVAHADVNASHNIAAEAAVVWERGAESTAPAPA